MTITDKNHLRSLWHRGRSLLRPETGRGQLETEDHCQKRARFMAMAAEQEACLLRMARRLCQGNDDRAQDLVQETLLRAYEAYLNDRFQEGTNARAWLLRILTNNFLMEYRRQKRWQMDTAETLNEENGHVPAQMQAAPTDIPGTRLLTQTFDEPLEHALAMLPEGLRLCVLLVDVEELSYAEAASTLSIPIGTVRSRLFRAHQQLQTRLHEYAVQKRLVRE